MPTNEDGRSDDHLSVNRRDLLRTVGAAGAIGAFGAGNTAGQPPNEFIVGVTHGRSAVAKRRANSARKTIDFGSKIGQAVVGRWPERALRGLRNNPHVRYIQRNGTLEPLSHPAELQWGVDRVDAEVAHAAGDTGNGVHIAILDTGIDADHPDLLGNLGAGHSPVNCQDLFHPNASCDEDWDDDDGHGTHVAGIANAVQNSTAVVGVSTEATLHAVKVCQQFTRPDGSIGTGCPFSEVADGINTAVDEGYDVINMSLGACCPACGAVGDGSGDCDSCPDTTGVMKDAIERATDNGLVVVSSAGNDGDRPDCDGDGDRVCDDGDCVGTPANHPDVIAVSSTTDGDTLSGFSSVGPEVDIAAPGSSIVSTFNNGGTATLSGTSMAAPHVAGAAAQLIGAGTSGSNVRSQLTTAAEDIGLDAIEQGAGLLDVANALGHDSANDLTEVVTLFATDVKYTEARLQGQLTRLIGNDSADVFFEYREVGAGSWTVTPTEILTSTDSFERIVTGLEEDTSYEFRAGATVTEPSEGWSSTEYGEAVEFPTVNNPDPTASFTHDPAVPDPGDVVTFDASGSHAGEAVGIDEGDSIVSYEWDFENDGTFDETTTDPTTTHTYSDPGDVTVRLRVTDEFDQTDETTEEIRVNAPPEAAFTVSPDPVVRNETATFDASGSNDPDGTILSYEWDFDDDGTFEVSTVSPTIDHTFTTGGEKTVTLQVTDNDDATGAVSETFTVHIRVDIDIKPGGENDVNPRSKGNVPVAVLQTAAFDPTSRLDHATVRFGSPDAVGFDTGTDPFTPEGGATPAHAGGHVEDVDDDGDADSMFHFPTPDAGFDSDDTEGELVGVTHDGVPVFGTDSVTIVGGGGGP